MPCIPFEKDGARGFICTSAPRRQRCVGCGQLVAPRALRLCDWKTPQGKKPTCDAPVCGRCTYSPAPEKDLCPTHAAEWKARIK